MLHYAPPQQHQHSGNHDQLHGLRQAVHALYHSSESAQRRSADRWLRNTPGSWRLCLQLLDVPNTLEEETFFASNTIKTVCQKYQDVLDQHVAPQLPAQLAVRIHAFLQQQLTVPAAQLSAGLGALVVRSHMWHPSNILPTIQSLLVQAAVDPASGVQLLDPGSLASLLHCWAAVAEAAASKQVAVLPERRVPVTEALQQSLWVAPMVCAALQTQSPELVQRACQTICRWCELGRAPAGLEARPDALEVIASAVLQPQLNQVASECMVLLLTTCKDQTHVPATKQLLQHLLQLLQVRLLPPLVMQASALRLPSPGAVLGQQMGERAEVSFCQILAAAAGALLKLAWQEGGQLLMLLQSLQDQLLRHVQDPIDGVALAALEFWHDSYLEPLVALSEDVQPGVVQQQQPVLQALAAAVIQRTQLSVAIADAATADARDLPEEMRTVRREMAAALRDITQLLGLPNMLGFITQLVQQYWQHLTPAVAPGPGGFGGVGVAGGSTGAPSSSKHRWLELECAMYAANVVLGKANGEFPVAVQEHLDALTQLAAAGVTHPSGSMKLAGTCLTLLGGLAPWYVQQPHKLPPLLSCMNAALKAADEKLVRNAATCVQRLSASNELCALLVAQQPAFVDNLVQEYHRRGGLQMRAGQGDDMPTEELLLLALCNLAVASSKAAVPNSPAPDQLDDILLQLVAPQLTTAIMELQEAGKVLSSAGAVTRDGTAAQPQLTQQQTTSVINACNSATRCFRSLNTLVSGLPTKLPKSATVLTAKTVKPPPPRPADLQQPPGTMQRQWPAGPEGGMQPMMLSPGGPRPSSSHAGYRTGSPSMPRSSNPYSVQQGMPPAAPPVSTPKPLSAAAAARAAAEAVGPHEHHARWLVHQLVNSSWHLVQLSRQALVVLFQAQLLAPPLSSPAEQLLIAMCEFVAASMPGAARAKPPQSQLMTPPAATADAAAAQVQSVQRLVVQVLQELGQLPGNAIQQPCCLHLLGMVLNTLGAEDLGWGAADGRSILSGQQLKSSVAATAADASADAAAHAAALQQQERDQMLSLQMLQLLQEQMQKTISHSCGVLVAQQGRADPHHVATVLLLVTAAIQRTPCVLTYAISGPAAEQTLALLQLSASTYHLEQCHAVLACLQALVLAPYEQVTTPEQIQLLFMQGVTVPPSSAVTRLHEAGSGSSSSSTNHNNGQAPAVAAVIQGREQVLSQLRTRLESGWAPRLVLSLLLAASGQMPPDVVVQVAACLHAIWIGTGDTVFGSWLDLAVVHMAPEYACWHGLRHQQKVAFMQQLMERACRTDLTRFKKVLKAFCTGKRKGR